MKHMEKKTNKQTTRIVLLVILVVAVAIGISALAAVLIHRHSSTEPERNKLVYEANVVTDDADALQAAVDALAEQVKEGQMALKMQTQAVSSDGQHFTCYLGNSTSNTYDMYMVLYLDDTQEEIYRSGLVPVGAHIEEFDLEEPLPSGNYETTLVYNQVEDDQETIHAQVNVGLTLIVK